MEKNPESPASPPENGDVLSSTQSVALAEENSLKAPGRWESYSLSTLAVFFDNC
jgi:hypothetical protein